jgi:cytidylate kinase
MNEDRASVKYISGAYSKLRPSATKLTDRYIREWEEKRLEMEHKEPQPELPATICASRKIGVGALGIADILAEKIGSRVIDREIVELIANQAKLSQKTVALFDEQYPGEIAELLSLAFREKAFIKSDYTRHLFSTILSVAGLGPAIFVGRGAHMLLPRDRVLAVRLIASKEHRIKQLARILDIEKEMPERKLEQTDREQKDFFKKVYGKRDASPYEFDLVINCDFISEPRWAADIVALAFKEKFGPEMATAW